MVFDRRVATHYYWGHEALVSNLKRRLRASSQDRLRTVYAIAQEAAATTDTTQIPPPSSLLLSILSRNTYDERPQSIRQHGSISSAISLSRVCKTNCRIHTGICGHGSGTLINVSLSLRHRSNLPSVSYDHWQVAL